MLRKKLFLWNLVIALALVFISTSVCLGAETPFPGLITYVEKEYGKPFQVVGQVKEVSKDRLLFARSAISVVRGERLYVCDHKEGVSPQLQVQVALIRVEAIFPKSVLARVEKHIGREIEPGDWVLTPPVPLIHVYTNISNKHAFSPYQSLIAALISAGMQIQEIEGDIIEKKLDPADLLLRVEAEAGQLVCRLTTAPRGPLLYIETRPNSQHVQLAFEPGHLLRVGRPFMPPNIPPSAPPPASVPSGPAPSRKVPSSAAPLPAKSPVSRAKPAFAVAKPLEKTGFYRLSGAYSRVVQCDLEGDHVPELALLGRDGVYVFSLHDDRLVEKNRYKFQKKRLFPIHLHAMDLNNDGGDELFVTLAEPVELLDKEDNRLVSQILTLKGDALQPLIKSWPYYLRVIQDRRGNAVALAQKEGEYVQFDGPIYQVIWDQTMHRPKIGPEYKPAKGVYSIYQFNLVPTDPDRIIILEPNNDLHGYFAPQERLEAVGERNYGQFREIAYPLKLEQDKYLGGFDKQTFRDIYAPRRFELRTEFDNQCFLIHKERTSSSAGIVMGTIKRALRSSLGEDQVVGIKWKGDRVVETWHSKKLAKDILDFTFLKDPASILVLYRDDDGFALEAFY